MYEEDPGYCEECKTPFELIRPGKSQPTCECHLKERIFPDAMYNEIPQETRCSCPICTENNRIRQIAESGDVERMRNVIYELLDSCLNANYDLEINKTILDGGWPDSGDLLEEALEKFRRNFP